MRTTDQAIQPAAISAMQPSGNVAMPTSQALAAMPLANRLKAVGLVALTGALGIGAVLLGWGLWHSEFERTRLLTPKKTEDQAQPTSLRDRIRVITLDPTTNGSPESPQMMPLDAARQAQLRQHPQSQTSRVNHRFDSNSQPSTGVAPMPTQSQGQAIAQATPTATAPLRTTTRRSVSPAAVITALLQPLQPTTSGAVATVPHADTDTGSPGEAPKQGQSAPNPSNQAAPGAATLTPSQSSDRNPSVQTVPTAEATALDKPSPRTDGIYVDRLTLTGNTRFSQRELAAIVRKTIGSETKLAADSDPLQLRQRLTPAELVQASEAITKLYTDRGYINSGAYVPAEVLNGAAPAIRIVEGTLEAIHVEVKRPKFLWFGRSLAENYVRGRLAQAIRLPLQIDQLADAVKLLEQDPLIGSVSTTLAPGTTTGKSILNVVVDQAVPLHATLAVDNGRAPSVGRLRQQVSVSQANLLGLGDRLQVGYNRSEGSNGWDVGYSLPINASNGTLSFNYSSNRGRVIEPPFQDLDIKSRSQLYEVALRQPLKQTSTEEFALTLRATHYRNEGVFLETFNNGVALPFPAQGSDLNGVTSVTALRFGQEWLKRGERDVLSLQSEFSLGLNALNATILDAPPDGRFLSWQGRGFWVHAFAPDLLLALKGQVQLADRPLVPIEQLSLGGLDTVRGYRTSTLLSDTGWLASAEAYLPILRLPKWQGVLQVVPFFDIAQGKNRGDIQPSPNHLASVGIGLQWKLGNKFRARLDWGFPLINDTATNGQSLKENLFFSVVFTP